MNYKDFNLGDWIGHISGVIEDETTLDGNEMRDLVEFLSTLEQEQTTKNDLVVDCISREQAIDAFPDLLPNMGYSKKTITEILQKVPPITPQESCEDAVSRKAVVKYIKTSEADLWHDSENESVVEDILNMPSVTPQEPRWIPVSERLPKKNVWVLVTFKMANGKNGIDITRINQWNGQWEDEIDIPYSQNIIAWMPLPKPYEAESEDKE